MPKRLAKFTWQSGLECDALGQPRQAKTQLPEIIERVERGEAAIITRGKTPVARLIPYAPEQPQRGIGSM